MSGPHVDIRYQAQVLRSHPRIVGDDLFALSCETWPQAHIPLPQSAGIWPWDPPAQRLADIDWMIEHRPRAWREYLASGEVHIVHRNMIARGVKIGDES